MGRITASITWMIPLDAEMLAFTMLALLPTAVIWPDLFTEKVDPSRVSMERVPLFGKTLLAARRPSVTWYNNTFSTVWASTSVIAETPRAL